MSWIWKKVLVEDTDEGYLTDRLCAEWCKLRAHAECFKEEVALRMEEMKQVLCFFTWKATNWNAQAIQEAWLTDGDYPLQVEGHVAYTKQQADMYLKLKMHCEALWKDLPAFVTQMSASISIASVTLLELADRHAIASALK